MKKLLEIQNAICKAIREGRGVRKIAKKYKIKFVQPLQVTEKNIKEIGDKTFVFHYHNDRNDNMVGFAFRPDQLERYKNMLDKTYVDGVSLWAKSQKLNWQKDDLVVVVYIIHSTMDTKEYFNLYHITRSNDEVFYEVFIEDFPNDYQAFVDYLEEDVFIDLIENYR